MSLPAFDAALSDHAAFWSQHGEEPEVFGIELARAFDAVAWAAVDAFWRARPVPWRRCLVACLEELGAPPARAWLVEMAADPDEGLALAAVEAFRALRLSGFPAALVPRVRALWAARYRFSATQLEEVLADLARG